MENEKKSKPELTPFILGMLVGCLVTWTFQGAQPTQEDWDQVVETGEKLEVLYEKLEDKFTDHEE